MCKQKKCAIRTIKFCNALIYMWKMVGPQGLEPRTNGLWVRYSNQLSYRPFNLRLKLEYFVGGGFLLSHVLAYTPSSKTTSASSSSLRLRLKLLWLLLSVVCFVAQFVLARLRTLVRSLTRKIGASPAMLRLCQSNLICFDWSLWLQKELNST